MDDNGRVGGPPAGHVMSRRTFTLGAAAAIAGGALGGVLGIGAAAPDAAAQVIDPRPPTVDPTSLHEVADGVWVVRDHRIWLVPNIGIVLGRDAALVVDCGLGPANGERVLALARRLAGRRRLYLTLTHFHPEHGYGAQVFQRDATIFYNRAQRDELQQKGARYVGLFKTTQSKAAADALDGTQIVLPHRVYDGPRAALDLGGRTVEFHTWGTAHTRGDQVVFLPKERVLFAGDLIEERMFPIFPWFPPADTDIDAARWVRTLRGFREFDPALIVPGHGDPGGIDIALHLAAHIDAVGQEVRGLRQRGRTPAQILAASKSRIVAAYPGWEHPGLIDWEVGYFAARPT